MVLNSTVTVYGQVAPNPTTFDTKSKAQKVVGFSYPVGVNNQRGYFTKATGLTLVKNCLMQLLKTERGERYMLPNYGCSLRKYMMEPLDDILFNAIKDEIVQSINRYSTGVSITKIQIVPIPNSVNGGNGFTIKLFCAIKEPENTAFDIKVTLI